MNRSIEWIRRDCTLVVRSGRRDDNHDDIGVGGSLSSKDCNGSLLIRLADCRIQVKINVPRGMPLTFHYLIGKFQNFYRARVQFGVNPGIGERRRVQFRRAESNLHSDENRVSKSKIQQNDLILQVRSIIFLRTGSIYAIRFVAIIKD